MYGYKLKLMKLPDYQKKREIITKEVNIFLK